MQFYNEKLKVCGDYLFDYKYKRSISYDFNVKRVPSSILNDSDLDVSIDNNFYRIRRNVLDYVLCNYSKDSNVITKFLTLTFADNVTNLTEANYQFNLFIKNYKYYTGIFDLRYLAVPEFQEKRLLKDGLGAWHYHVPIFNSPYIDNDKIGQIWGNGFIKINAVFNTPMHCARYLTKYITKSKDKRLMGRKHFFRSRSLYTPFEFRKPDNVSLGRSLVAGIPPDWSKQIGSGDYSAFLSITNLSNNLSILARLKDLASVDSFN